VSKTNHHVKHHQCQNCGTELPNLEEYCPNCGQQNHDLKLPFKHLVLEILESLFHFETKFWVTLKSMIGAPGKITKEFVDGKRATYMNPFRMYVFVSIIFFLLVGVLTRDKLKDIISKKIENLDEVEKEINAYENIKKITCNFKTSLIDSINLLSKYKNKAIGDSVLQLKRKRNKKERVFLTNYATYLSIHNDTLNHVSELKKALGINQKGSFKSYNKVYQFSDIDNEGFNKIYNGIRDLNKNDSNWTHEISYYDTIKPLSIKDEIKIMGFSDLQMDSLIVKRNKRNNKLQFSFFNKTITKSTFKFRAKEIFYNDPNYIKNTVIKYASIAMFFVMPFFALIIYFFHIRRKPSYFYEMLIFSIHFHTLVFIIFSLYFILEIILKDHLPNLFVLAPLFLMIYALFKSLRYVFKQTFLKSIIKEFLIVIVYFFFLGIIFIGLLSYSTLVV
jgi:Protein of unknown function (DUF3667)